MTGYILASWWCCISWSGCHQWLICWNLVNLNKLGADKAVAVMAQVVNNLAKFGWLRVLKQSIATLIRAASMRLDDAQLLKMAADLAAASAWLCRFVQRRQKQSPRQNPSPGSGQPELWN